MPADEDDISTLIEKAMGRGLTNPGPGSGYYHDFFVEALSSLGHTFFLWRVVKSSRNAPAFLVQVDLGHNLPTVNGFRHHNVLVA